MSSSFQDDLLQSYSDDELVHHIHNSPRLAPMSRVYLLSTNLLAKCIDLELVEDSVTAMDVAHELGVRVPSVKRTVQSKAGAYCIMERIKGTTLEEAWAGLSWFSTIQLALQLRRFIKLLRSVTSLTAGSLATGECWSFWLEDRYGLPARSSPEAITSFIQFWVDFVSIRRAKKAAAEGAGHPKGRVPPTAKTLLFTHHDLAPRNLLLDSSGQLWLLDWDYAGFYPSYFEYASMQNFFKPQDWTWLAQLRWYLFTWIAVGRSERAANVLELIRSRFIRSRVGRRFEILENRAPFRYPCQPDS
jgi:Phosphotransferase enzyme family